jgi:hypothetical protein
VQDNAGFFAAASSNIYLYVAETISSSLSSLEILHAGNKVGVAFVAAYSRKPKAVTYYLHYNLLLYELRTSSPSSSKVPFQHHTEHTHFTHANWIIRLLCWLPLQIRYASLEATKASRNMMLNRLPRTT